jgi:UDP-GlcNAc:undecaprenyl-phosphate GlcNAc-1-phosphate transferase
MNIQLLIPALTATVITICVTPLVIAFARRFHLVDDAKQRPHPAHTHTGVIPRAGGLAIYIGLVVTMLTFLSLTRLTISVIAGCTLLVVMGLIDDKRDINPYVRLTTNAIAALLIVAAGIGVPYITNPFTGTILPLDTIRFSFTFFGPHSIVVLADIIAFIWIMWTMNIIGWSAGVEGQMPGFVAISAFVLGILSLRFSIADPSQLPVTLLAFIVCGSFLGFLPWNFFPQKIMPGYGGKTLAGYLLAILGILSYGKFGTALLVLGIPTIDAIYTLLRRIGKGRSPVWADREHFHHKLLDLGWGKRSIALFYWVVSAILGAIALAVNSQQKLFAFLLLFVGASGFLLWVNFFTQLSKPPDPDNG